MKMIVDWSEYAELYGTVHFFCFRPEKPFLDKFGPENQNCQFKLKLSTKTNSNMHNSVMTFTFSVFGPKT